MITCIYAYSYMYYVCDYVLSIHMYTCACICIYNNMYDTCNIIHTTSDCSFTCSTGAPAEDAKILPSAYDSIGGFQVSSSSRGCKMISKSVGLETPSRLECSKLVAKQHRQVVKSAAHRLHTDYSCVLQACDNPIGCQKCCSLFAY